MCIASYMEGACVRACISHSACCEIDPTVDVANRPKIFYWYFRWGFAQCIHVCTLSLSRSFIFFKWKFIWLDELGAFKFHLLLFQLFTFFIWMVNNYDRESHIIYIWPQSANAIGSHIWLLSILFDTYIKYAWHSRLSVGNADANSDTIFEILFVSVRFCGMNVWIFEFWIVRQVYARHAQNIGCIWFGYFDEGLLTFDLH